MTIRAVQPGSVQVMAGLTGSSVQCPGQTMRQVDLAMAFLNIADCTCALDGCSVTDAYGIHGACVSTQHATVVLNGRDLIGANPSQIIFGSYAGLAATAWRISAVDCTFRGRPGDLFAYSGGQPGIYLWQGSTLHGARLTIQGGYGNTATAYPPGPALRAEPGSSFWVADADLRSGLAMGLPGTPPLQAGSPFQIEFQVEPSQFVGVFASLGLASLVLPEFEQPIALDLASLINLGIVVADGAGHATGTWALPPGTANLQLWLQGVTTSALPLQVGPAVGGVVR